MTTMVLKHQGETTDGGKIYHFRNGHKQATHVAYHRGGCLYAGTITLRDMSNGNTKEVDSTAMEVSGAYVTSLWEKHLG